jgi:transcriptional regulator with XRE-family HTH domain
MGFDTGQKGVGEAHAGDNGVSLHHLARAKLPRAAEDHSGHECPMNKPALIAPKSDLQKRLEALLQEKGMSMREVSLAAGLNETAVKAIMNGKSVSPRGQSLIAIAKALQIDLATLLGVQPGLDRTLERRSVERTAGAVTIAELDVRAMGGGGALDAPLDGQGHHVVLGEWQLPEDYLRSFTPAPGDVRIIRVVGDSMEPHYPAGDRVLIDTSHRIPSPPGVYVIWDGFALILKHAEVLAGRKPPMVRLSSDNPAYAPYEVPVADLMVQGRVMGKWVWK